MEYRLHFCGGFNREVTISWKECCSPSGFDDGHAGDMAMDTISGVRNEKARRYLSTMRKKQHVHLGHKFPNAGPLALQLLQRLLVFDPKDRPTVEEGNPRTQNAHLYAAVSVAGVTASVTALVASSLTSPETSVTQPKAASKTYTALATAAALVASHCIEIAEDMGADNEQILIAITSAINAKTNGDIMTNSWSSHW